MRLKYPKVHAVRQPCCSSEVLLHVRSLKMSIKGLKALPLLDDDEMVGADGLLKREGRLNVDCRLILNAAGFSQDGRSDLVEFSHVGISHTFLAFDSGNHVNNLGRVHLIYI